MIKAILSAAAIVIVLSVASLPAQAGDSKVTRVYFCPSVHNVKYYVDFDDEAKSDGDVYKASQRRKPLTPTFVSVEVPSPEVGKHITVKCNYSGSGETWNMSLKTTKFKYSSDSVCTASGSQISCTNMYK